MCYALHMASELGYGVLGFFTAHIGGAVAGYMYASRENELAKLEGRTPQKSEFVSAGLGILLAPFSGAYYGYQLAKTINRIEAISVQEKAPITPNRTNEIAVSTELTPDIAQTKWQDAVSRTKKSELAQATGRSA